MLAASIRDPTSKIFIVEGGFCTTFLLSSFFSSFSNKLRLLSFLSPSEVWINVQVSGYRLFMSPPPPSIHRRAPWVPAPLPLPPFFLSEPAPLDIEKRESASVYDRNERIHLVQVRSLVCLLDSFFVRWSFPLPLSLSLSLVLLMCFHGLRNTRRPSYSVRKSLPYSEPCTYIKFSFLHVTEYILLISQALLRALFLFNKMQINQFACSTPGFTRTGIGHPLCTYVCAGC